MTEPITPPALVYAGDDHLLYLDDRQVHVRPPDRPLEHLPVESAEAQALYRRHLDPLLARSASQQANELLAALDDVGTTSAGRILSGCIASLTEEDLGAHSGRQEVMTGTESYVIDWDRRTISTGETTHELLAVHHLLPGQDGLVRIGGVEDTGLPTHRRLGLVLRIQDLPASGE